MKEYIITDVDETAAEDFKYLTGKKVSELIRCKDCKYWSWEAAGCKKHNGIICANADDYCSRAERREK